jgi:HPt (histidine-containing phosphotransfer) domain-containing protein
MSGLVEREKLLDRFDQDMEFLAETVDVLESDGRALLDELRGASQAGDQETLTKKAHALKGMVSNFCADSVDGEIKDIEQRARAGELGELPSKLEQFAASFERLCRETRAIASGGQA